jgi:hypothetical protein
MVRGPTIDPKFLGTLESWFQSQSQILALVRIRCGAGARDFEFFSSYEALKAEIQKLSAGTWITIFKQPQLPLRGIVDDNFISKCLSSIPDGSEYLIVEAKLTIAGRMSWFHDDSGVSHSSLREDLEGSRGVPVAVGLHPPVFGDTNEVIHAIVPDEDGIVRAGPY